MGHKHMFRLFGSRPSGLGTVYVLLCECGARWLYPRNIMTAMLTGKVNYYRRSDDQVFKAFD